MISTLAVALTLHTTPYTLPIGTPGFITVEPGTMASTSNGRKVTATDVAVAARGHRFVYLGESHDDAAHHQVQADVIEALVKDGRQVVVGFEMFTRPNQAALNPWTLGWWSEDEFIQKADWKTQWGFDFALYRPIFNVVKANKLPMVALNVPRDWVRAVGRGGPDALTAEQKQQVPPIDTTNANHREVFNSLMGGHPPTGDQGEKIYSAQVLWDVAMADSALKYLDRFPSNPKTVFVVVAGSGHVMYGQGINYRIAQRTGEKGITVTMASSSEPMKVSRGIGEFVAVSVAKPTK